MYNSVLFGLYIGVTFLACMSLVFNVVGIFFDEEKLFSSHKSATILYVSAGIISVIVTFICCYVLSFIQLLS